MNKNSDYFIDIIEKQRRKNERYKSSNIAYGSNVLPILHLYNQLNYEEKMCYLDAIKRLLVDSDNKKRNFAMDICIGFIVFKDEIS